MHLFDSNRSNDATQPKPRSNSRTASQDKERFLRAIFMDHLTESLSAIAEPNFETESLLNANSEFTRFLNGEAYTSTLWNQLLPFYGSIQDATEKMSQDKIQRWQHLNRRVRLLVDFVYLVREEFTGCQL